MAGGNVAAAFAVRAGACDTAGMVIGHTRIVLLAAAAAAAIPLAIAFSSEWWGGLVPCALCLVERWPYRIAVALALLGAVLPAKAGRSMLALVLLAGLANSVAGGVHVGVEYKLWPSPLPECAAPKFETGSIAQRLRSMPAHPAKPCDEPVYLYEPVPISFAELNLLFALVFSAGVASFLLRSGKERA